MGTSALLPTLLDEFGDEARPARLMVCAQPGAVVAVKVLVEQDQVLPVRIGLELLGAAEHRTPAALVPQEELDEPPRELRRHLREVQQATRAGRKLHLEVVPQEIMELLQRFNDQ